MIVDCYTHTWESPSQPGTCGTDDATHRAIPHDLSDPLAAGAGRHLAAAEPVDTTIVVGFTSCYLGADIANDRIAEYVAGHPDRLIGFAGIDPSDPAGAIAELHRVREALHMPGIAVAPAAQDFHPTSSHAMRVYAEAAGAGMPILFHTGVRMGAPTKLEYARPVLLDEIARELPDLKIVVAHMGYPWTDETILLLAKHRHVYAEISWLLPQPWQAYLAILAAHQHGVTDKLLFGSGFPYARAANCIEELYGINHFASGTNLPTIPRDALRGIVERDALGLLGIHRPREQNTLQPITTIPNENA
ncbi:MAG: amidohydrolase family protein [Phycisphaerae bacterium]